MDGSRGDFFESGANPGDLTPQELLDELNTARTKGVDGKWKASAEAYLHARYGANHRLAVYGSLAPARCNHHVLQPLAGEWRRGSVRGRLYSSGWGAGKGFPGMCLDEYGDDVEVTLLTSASLASEWGRLDAFEGGEYVRLLAVVSFGPAGYTMANIYALRSDPAASE